MAVAPPLASDCKRYEQGNGSAIHARKQLVMIHIHLQHKKHQEVVLVGFTIIDIKQMRKEKIDTVRLHANFNPMNTRYVTAEDGSKTDVILPVADYEALMEDLQDLATIAERREEPTYSLEEVKESLKADGLL